MTSIENRIFSDIQAFEASVDSDLINKKIVFTNGCFDILHPGHVDYLERSKSLGEVLVVGLNHDASVARLKGLDRPFNSWAHRAQVLAALRAVDFVIGFRENTPLQLIQKLRPNFITKGGDYKLQNMIGKDFVESYGGQVKIFPVVGDFSSSQIISKLKK